MINYLKADFYRLFKHKSFYIFNGIIALGFILLNYFILGSNGKVGQYIEITMQMLGFIPLITGMFVFNNIYNDNFSSNVVNGIIGSGVKRKNIVIYNFISTILFSFIIFLFYTLVFFAFGKIYGFSFSTTIIKDLLTKTMAYFLSVIGYVSMASIILYFSKKVIYGTTLYIFLASGIISMLVNLILSLKFVVSTFGVLGRYLFTSLINSIVGGNYKNLVGIFIYITISIIISIIVFSKKDLEFN